jgi:pimeloyl-ACP methyl ester carboxylesterase
MVVVTNRRGLAESSGLSDLENEILGLREVVEAVGTPAVLLGGCEASAAPIALAAGNPHHVRALILVNGSARMAADVDYPGIPAEGLQPAVDGVRHDWEQFFRSFLGEVAPIPWADLDTAFEVFRQFVTAEGLAAFMEKFVLADVRRKLSGIVAPTLVIHSTENEVIPFAQGQYLATHVSGARLHPLQGARHHIDPSYNDEVAQAVKDFLDGLN